MQENMRRTAYLVAIVFVDPTGNMLPQIHHVGIYSENASSLSSVGHTRVMLDVHSATGETYEDARNNLIRDVEKNKWFAWCRPLMEKRQAQP